MAERIAQALTLRYERRQHSIDGIVADWILGEFLLPTTDTL